MLNDFDFLPIDDSLYLQDRELGTGIAFVRKLSDNTLGFSIQMNGISQDELDKKCRPCVDFAKTHNITVDRSQSGRWYFMGAIDKFGEFFNQAKQQSIPLPLGESILYEISDQLVLAQGVLEKQIENQQKRALM
jgi:hypothetical protein